MLDIFGFLISLWVITNNEQLELTIVPLNIRGRRIRDIFGLQFKCSVCIR